MITDENVAETMRVRAAIKAVRPEPIGGLVPDNFEVHGRAYCPRCNKKAAFSRGDSIMVEDVRCWRRAETSKGPYCIDPETGEQEGACLLTGYHPDDLPKTREEAITQRGLTSSTKEFSYRGRVRSQIGWERVLQNAGVSSNAIYIVERAGEHPQEIHGSCMVEALKRFSFFDRVVNISNMPGGKNGI